MRRICGSGVAFLILSGVWHRCLDRKCEEAVQRQEHPHTEREDRRPLTSIETPGTEARPPVFFADDGEQAVYEVLFRRPVRTPWLVESTVGCNLGAFKA
jgi:hypothetical protein